MGNMLKLYKTNLIQVNFIQVNQVKTAENAKNKQVAWIWGLLKIMHGASLIQNMREDKI